MDAINDILSEFIDKKKLVKGLFSKIQSAIFLDKLQESKTAFVSQRAHEPYTPCQPKNFEIKFYLPDYFDNYNTNKPARMYIRTINGVMPYLKLLVKIYTDTGIIPKVVELYQFDRWMPRTGDVLNEQELKSYERNRNLFYVCCSRAKRNLILFVTIPLEGAFKQYLESLVGASNIIEYDNYISV